jgi:cytoskeletal protein RodZ
MLEKTKKKRKIFISATLVMTVLLVGIIVANILVWQDHLGKRAGADTLTDQIAQVNQKIKEVPEPPDNLAARLEAAQAELKAAETAIPATINRNDVIDYIIDLADECQVEAVPLIVEGWIPQDAGAPYSALKLNVTVTGSLAGVTSLISGLQDSKYKSLTITNLTITRQNQPGVSSGFGDDTPVTVGMNIALYTYSPAS